LRRAQADGQTATGGRRERRIEPVPTEQHDRDGDHRPEDASLSESRFYFLGDGANTVTIDDLLFAGKFALTTGAGNDTLNIETSAGSSAPTQFDAPVVVSNGGRN
jgi:hypothetical protein